MIYLKGFRCFAAVLVYGLICLCVPVGHLSAQDKHADANVSQQSKAATEERGSGANLGNEPLQDPDINPNESKQAERSEGKFESESDLPRRNTEAQENIAQFTGYLVFAQAITVILLIATVALTAITLHNTRLTLDATTQTLSASNAQTEIAREGMLLQHRPWFKTDARLLRFDPIVAPNTPVTAELEVELTNIGSSPAKSILLAPEQSGIFRYRIIETLKGQVLFESNAGSASLEAEQDAMIAPGQSRSFFIDIVFTGKTFPLDDVSDGMRMSTSIRADVALEYADLFSATISPTARNKMSIWLFKNIDTEVGIVGGTIDSAISSYEDAKEQSGEQTH